MGVSWSELLLPWLVAAGICTLVVVVLVVVWFAMIWSCDFDGWVGNISPRPQEHNHFSDAVVQGSKSILFGEPVLPKFNDETHADLYGIEVVIAFRKGLLICQPGHVQSKPSFEF
ncbi:hypothetical protein GBA52_004285 [Prunus armeniaca]|nr:hypothetical protein GBA52_004285 [Prunus armeniaca]